MVQEQIQQPVVGTVSETLLFSGASPHTGTQIVTLHTPGALPGIPGGGFGPGVFLVDWDARTCVPYEGDTSSTPAALQRATKQVAAPAQTAVEGE